MHLTAIKIAPEIPFAGATVTARNGTAASHWHPCRRPCRAVVLIGSAMMHLLFFAAPLQARRLLAMLDAFDAFDASDEMNWRK